MLRVFVYGTLRHGHHNHLRCCQGHISRRPAVLPGRVIQRPEGFPMLFVPLASILGHGSGNLERDIDLPRHVTPPSQPLSLAAPPWRLVLGEILEFADAVPRLALLDDLEDFEPGRPSVYCRVLVTAIEFHGPSLCWTYGSPHNTRFENEFASTHLP